MTYRYIWEIYVKPNLKAQEQLTNMPTASQFSDSPVPVSIDEKIVEAQAMGMMFGADPLEVGKATRKSWPPTRADIDAIRAKLEAREKAEK